MSNTRHPTPNETLPVPQTVRDDPVSHDHPRTRSPPLDPISTSDMQHIGTNFCNCQRESRMEKPRALGLPVLILGILTVEASVSALFGASYAKQPLSGSCECLTKTPPSGPSHNGFVVRLFRPGVDTRPVVPDGPARSAAVGGFSPVAASPVELGGWIRRLDLRHAAGSAEIRSASIETTTRSSVAVNCWRWWPSGSSENEVSTTPMASSRLRRR
jgi:hypothetical protein